MSHLKVENKLLSLLFGNRKYTIRKGLKMAFKEKKIYDPIIRLGDIDKKLVYNDYGRCN